jgi:predicted membrane chloride channel (bestrophin family)
LFSDPLNAFVQETPVPGTPSAYGRVWDDTTSPRRVMEGDSEPLFPNQETHKFLKPLYRASLDEEQEFPTPPAFIRALFYWKGTVIPPVIPQAIFAYAVFCAVRYLNVEHGLQPTSDFTDLYSTLGFFLAVVFSMRVNHGFSGNDDGLGCLYDCQSAMGDLVMATENFETKKGTEVQQSKLRVNIRNKVNLLFAFIRQSIRESKCGFHPDSHMKRVKFNDETFFYDPVKPEIRDMASLTDFQTLYARFSPGDRVTYVAGELQALTGEFSTHCESSGEYTVATNCAVATMMASHSGAQRIISEPVPFVYAHMLNVLLFLYVFMAPLQLLNSGGLNNFGLIAVLILCFGFYGINEAAIRMANPFGWDPVDLDIGAFAASIASSTKAISAGAGN